jgi:hypothetical protein
MANKVKRAKGSIRAKSGLPAKAGRRKVYGPASKRKQKDWGSMGTGYCMASISSGASVYSPSVCASNWKSGQPVMVARDKYGVTDSPRLTETEMRLRKEALARASYL